jgi:hypothetical protein
MPCTGYDLRLQHSIVVKPPGRYVRHRAFGNVPLRDGFSNAR